MVRDELTDEQRARLCILEAVRELMDDDLDVFELTRLSGWVESGRRPDQDTGAKPQPFPEAVEATEQAVEYRTARWAPAVR